MPSRAEIEADIELDSKAAVQWEQELSVCRFCAAMSQLRLYLDEDSMTESPRVRFEGQKRQTF